MPQAGWLTTGARTHALEAAFAERLGAPHALAVNSGTAALHLALDGFGIGADDEVVVPAYTFTACGEVCSYLGARVVLADVGEDALLGPDQLTPVLSDATRAVMPVHFAGQAVDVDALRQVAPDLVYVEDAAHALPASVQRDTHRPAWRGRRLQLLRHEEHDHRRRGRHARHHG